MQVGIEGPQYGHTPNWPIANQFDVVVGLAGGQIGVLSGVGVSAGQVVGIGPGGGLIYGYPFVLANPLAPPAVQSSIIMSLGGGVTVSLVGGAMSVVGPGSLAIAVKTTITGPLNTIAAFSVADPNFASYYGVDTRLGTVLGGQSTHQFATPGPSFAAAAGSSYHLMGLLNYVMLLTGGVGVTALNGLSLYILAPTVSDATPLLVGQASTVYIDGAPIGAGLGPVSFTNSWALHVNGPTLVSAPPGASAGFRVSNGTTAYYTANLVTNASTFIHQFNTPALSIPSAAGTVVELVQLVTYNVDLTGGVGVTALDGMALYIGNPSISSSVVTTVATASTVYIAGAPGVIGSASVPLNFALHVGAGLTALDGGLRLAATNLSTDTTTGMQIATAGGAAGQKMAFWGAAPAVQPLCATGTAKTVDNLITIFQTMGLLRQA